MGRSPGDLDQVKVFVYDTQVVRYEVVVDEVRFLCLYQPRSKSAQISSGPD